MNGLKSVYDQLESIAKVSSTKEKIKLLQKFLEDPLFLKVITYALDERLTFYIKKFPEYKKGKKKVKPKEIFSMLDALNAKGSATNFDKNELFRLAGTNKATYEVVRRICIKDLRCGCSIKLINKARPGTVLFVPYQRCKKDEKLKTINFEDGAVAQEKADGTFVNIWIRSEEKIQFVTRNFQKVKQLKKLKIAILNGVKKTNRDKPGSIYGILNQGRMKKNFIGNVYHGELVVVKKGKILDRKTGNGIISQCIQGTASKKDAECVCVRIWDCIPEKEFWIDNKCKEAYRTRKFKAEQFVRAVNDNNFVQSILSKQVKSVKEAKEFYKKIRENCGEGVIVKNLSGIWKDNQSGSSDQIKMKNVSDGDLRVVGWKFGKKGSKYEKIVGSIICESECGKLSVSVSGLNDEQREWDWDMLIGSIVEVEYESVIKDKGQKKHSLYLPTFVRVRHDKSQANTLKELKKS